MSSSAPRRRAPRSRAALAAALLLALACTRARPPLRVGTSGDYPPFSVAEGTTWSGLDVEVARRFTRDLGRPLALVPFRWPDLVADLDADRFDVAMGGVTMRPERAERATFTRPVAATGATLLVPPEAATAPPLADITLRVAVNRGGHLERVAQRLLPRAALFLAERNGDLADLVVAGRADAVLTDDVEADVLAARLPRLVRRGPLTRDRKAYLARDPALAATLDAWLRAREADGTLAALRARWLGPARGRAVSAFRSDLDALEALVDLRLAFMPAIAAAKAAAGRPIADPAQEARVLAAVRERAQAAGLADDAATALFTAQLAAAREAQAAFLAASSRPPVDRLDLETQARPALARLSEAIVARAAAVAADPAALAALDPASVADELDPALASADSRRAIAAAIVGLRLAATASEPHHGEPTSTREGM